MSLIIILAALALLLGTAILFIKIASFVAENGESLTKALLAATFILLILAAIAHFKPELIPGLTQVCNTVAAAIQGFAKPLIG